jgi:hypothetical protein
VSLASAATVSIGFANTANISITGTTTITAFDNVAEGALRWVTFAGALTLAHNAASLQLPGAANIVTVAGDSALFKSLGGGNWKCLTYQRMSGYLTPAGGNLSGPLTFNNNVPLNWRDAGGTARLVMSMDGSNNLNIVNAGGATVQMLNQFGTVVQTWDNVGYSVLAGRQVIKSTVANGNARSFLDFQAQSGIARFRFALSETERQEIWTWDTAGNWTGAIGISQGGIQAAGAVSGTVFTGSSDERLKKKWRRRPADLLQRVAGIRKLGDFIWKKDGAPGIGVSAQELEAIWPEAVHYDDKGFRSVNYGAAAFVIAVELVRAFFAHVARTDKRLAKLEGK